MDFVVNSIRSWPIWNSLLLLHGHLGFCLTIPFTSLNDALHPPKYASTKTLLNSSLKQKNKVAITKGILNDLMLKVGLQQHTFKGDIGNGL